MARLVALTFTLASFAAPARAETIVIRSNPCPSAAEHPLIIDLGDVETFNASPGATLGNVLVIYPPLGDGWASARLLMRFDLDRPLETPPGGACSAPRLFRQPG